MNIISKKASIAINNSRLLFVIAIVCLHCRIDQDVKPTEIRWFIQYCCNFNISNDFVCHLIHPVVPSLFILSGYLFFSNMKERFGWNEYIYKIKKRVKSLLIPYLIWSIIGLIAIFYIYKKETPSLLYVIKAFTINPEGVLWYIRDLMLLAILAPVYYFIVKKIKLGGIIILYIITDSIFENTYIPILNLNYLLGAAIAINKISIENVLKIIDYKLCLIIYFILKIMSVYSQIQYNISILPILLLIGILGLNMDIQPKFKDAGFSTFLFFSHIYIKGIKSLLTKFIPINTDLGCLTLLLIRIFGTVMLSWILYKIIPKKVRPILIGGR